METNITIELERIVSSNVKREEYPTQVSLLSDKELRQELYDLKAEKIKRPATKEEYFSRLLELETAIADIAASNKQALLEFDTERVTIDNNYSTAVEAAKKDAYNIRDAEISVLVYKTNIEEATKKLVADGKITEKERYDFIAKYIT